MIAVFTPTCRYGGLDVTFEGLRRQNRDDICWLVCDELLDEREIIYEDLSYESGISIYPFKIPKKEGNRRNLAAAYNAGMALARTIDADLFLSLQDYIWIPDDGVSRFVRMAEQLPNDLLTGLTSISKDPYPDNVLDLKGHYTIFGSPYTDQPQVIKWRDCRAFGHGYDRRNPMEFETNWAAIPRSILMDTRLTFSEEYDKGVAYENQDLAFQAEDYGHGVWLDLDNHAISLPHKGYWPQEEQDDFAHINTEMHHKRWHIPLPEDFKTPA